MEQSPSWEPDSFVTSQENPPHFVDLNVHYHIHECVPLVPILSQSNLVHIHQSCFFKIHFTIILPSKHMCCKWPFSFRLPHRNLECISVLPHVCHMLSLFQPCCIYHPNNMWCGALVMNHTDSCRKIQQDATVYQNLLFHIYMKLSLFRATHHPSSGA